MDNAKREFAVTTAAVLGKRRLRSRELVFAHGLSFLAILLALGILWLTYIGDRNAYAWLLKEDRLVEWLTFGCFAGAGFLSLVLAFHGRRFQGMRNWFFILFGLFCILCALEEISWGQRVVGVKTPEFFLKHSDQKEVNVHNVLQKDLGIKTRVAVGWVFGLYGVLLPLMTLFPRIAATLHRIGLRVPPLSLVPGFLAASLLVIFDRPTGGEEEFGEFLFGLCFFLFMVLEHLRLQEPTVDWTQAESRAVFLRRKWFLYGSVAMLAAFLGIILAALASEGFLKRPYRLRHYMAAWSAARNIPREGSLVVSSTLMPLVGERTDSVTLESVRPGGDLPRFIFGFLTSGDTDHAGLLLKALKEEGFGQRSFDGDFFVLEKGGAAPPAPELRYVIEHWPETSFTAWTAGDIRETSYVKGAGIVRYWKGDASGRPVVVSYGKPQRLEPGQYRAVLRYMIEEKRSPLEGNGGSISLHSLGREGVIASMELGEKPEVKEAFRTANLEFLVDEAADVQSRVTGGRARLWLHWLVIEKIE